MFRDAIITYEDKRFYNHFGVDPVAVTRAIIQNYKSKKTLSGASTLTMQIIRMSRKGKSRNLYQKIIESILAVRLELTHSKKQMLKLYTSHAPFGGNVVGLEAASWRYFHKSSTYLSISEGAMLAVLPNAPSLIHIGKNRGRLLEKRNKLLKTMMEKGKISSIDYELSLLEKIPQKPFSLPRLAPHFLEYINKKEPQKIIQSTIDRDIQSLLADISDYHYQLNVQSDIHNLAILVLDTKSGEVIGYIGNAKNTKQESSVDMIHAKRSSGSVLKPFLYAHLLESGKTLPNSLVKDVPTHIQGYNPKNYNRRYMGAVPANQALSMSLNVPAVYALQSYGIEPFIKRLQDHGFRSINRTADHYGLSLILGGGEVTLWDLCGAYASLGRILLRYNQEQSRYSSKDIYQPQYTKQKLSPVDSYKPSLLSAGAIHHTFEAMKAVIRPNEEGDWQQFDSSSPIAWKTGTSYGHRDAWAVGVSPKYTIGIWVGNANGEGKHGLVGVQKAGPILFDVLNRLSVNKYFEEPVDDLIPTVICAKSGFLVSPHCDLKDTIFTLNQGQHTVACPYHKTIHLDNEGNQVTSACFSIAQMTHVSWFELSPSMAYYYRSDHPEYRAIPLHRPDCINEQEKVMEFLYPTEKTIIYLPIDLDGIKEKAIFKATHQNIDAILYWHLDNNYLGSTKELHTMDISANTGHHMITIIDQDGNQISCGFEIK